MVYFLKYSATTKNGLQKRIFFVFLEEQEKARLQTVKQERRAVEITQNCKTFNFFSRFSRERHTFAFAWNEFSLAPMKSPKTISIFRLIVS